MLPDLEEMNTYLMAWKYMPSREGCLWIEKAEENLLLHSSTKMLHK
jgi:hypothetical protein